MLEKELRGCRKERRVYENEIVATRVKNDDYERVIESVREDTVKIKIMFNLLSTFFNASNIKT